jgi:hypothetical protein
LQAESQFGMNRITARWTSVLSADRMRPVRQFDILCSIYHGVMTFTKRLREGVRRGEITCSVRIWTRPHVKVGNRYRMEGGEVEVESIDPISLQEITPQLARDSGFLGVIDLLKVAKHGKGQNIYLVRFHFVPPRRAS